MEDAHHKLSNSLRCLGAVACMAILLVRATRIATLGHALLYAASWVTFLHICCGVYVFVRHLRAYSHAQQMLDAVAAGLLAANVFFFTRPAIWSACLAAFTVVAITKYALLYPRAQDTSHRRYIRSKILLETPGAILLGLTAGILFLGDLPVWLALGLQAALLATTTTFAIWMIFIRRAYRKSAFAIA